MTIVYFLIILSVLILVHELGHFFLAKKLGIRIEEFGLGYPPRLWGKKIKGTIYSLNLLPFGGFVRMRGEDLPEGKGSFANKKKWVRLAVLLAGVTMNFLLGVILFGAIYTKIGIPQLVDYLLVTGVADGSPAASAGLEPGDKIVGVANFVWSKDKTKLTQEFVEFVNQNRGVTLKLTIVGKSDMKTIVVTPRSESETPEGEGALGVAITNADTIIYPYWQRPFRGIWVGLKEALVWGREILVALGMTLGQLISGQVPQDVAGPVGIYKLSQQVTKKGFLETLQFTGILSVNLAILNLLPLPALDGGRLVFLAVETLTRKRVKPKWEQMIHLTGMMLLIGLMILVTIHDLRR